ncbi:hypothetical protein AB0K47_21735 [Streptomyces tirandamycinicus]|uniref:hypothetical protein n=1 Tax=Streptomyces tirandamycinicus TaxID=2174846 RepID=UPI00341752C3
MRERDAVHEPASDHPTTHLKRIPGPDGDGGPEYLTTGWSDYPAVDAAPEPAGPPPHGGPHRGPHTSDVTVWNTAVHVLNPLTTGDPTMRLPDHDPAQDRLRAAWHGGGPARSTARSRRQARRCARWPVPAVLAVAAVAVLLWPRPSPELAVTGVTASVGAAEVPCGGSAMVVATVTTNGGTGTIRYRWIRSDGTDSGVLEQPVPPGREKVGLPLAWTFHGRGVHQARAVVDVLAPTSHTASVSFTYRCDGGGTRP